jgi:nucleotide-binding universal stress UspA family protein
MSHPASNPGAPRTVLLATDLSARGDRALERAVAIAESQGAHLMIVHVFEELDESTLSYGRRAAPAWERPPDVVAITKQRIRQGLRADLGDTVEKATLLIEEGDPAEVIEVIQLVRAPVTLVK